MSQQKRNKKSTNKFNRSYEGLRKFLRLISYGCYHRNLFKNKEINPRSYDEFLRQMRFFISDKNIQLTYYDKYAYFTFAGDFYHVNENYLYSSFLTKSLLASHCLQYLTILQIMSKSDSPLSVITIADEVAESLISYDLSLEDNDFLQLTRRRLNELLEAGLLRKINHNNKILYEIIPNPLEDLSNNELAQLQTALTFYRNSSLISLPGHFLYDAITNAAHNKNLPNIFQFKNNNFTRILDDDVLFAIVQALNQKKKLHIEREHKPPMKVIPLSIESDFLLNRQYLSAIRDDKQNLEPVKLRIDKIVKVKLLTEDIDCIEQAPKQMRAIYLCVHFKDDEERAQRESILSAHFDIEMVNATNDTFTCRISTVDPLRYYPLLWKFQPWAEILPEDNGLRERMMKDVDEALKNYDIVV